MRSPVTSRSNWANESSIFNVSRHILVVVFGRKDNMIIATVDIVTLTFIVHIYMLPKEDIGFFIHPQAPAWGVCEVLKKTRNGIRRGVQNKMIKYM